jgi:leader peptidase (prepilin peptidase)/N-methyltransferase
MTTSPELDAFIAGVLGMLIGSFLNVVIHRLPKMMEQQWAAECASLNNADARPAADQPAYNLVTPRSACPHCGHRIAWYQNLPLISYVVLRGKCSACGAGIGIRYPLVELATAVLFAWCGWTWGLTPTGAMWSGFSAAVVALAAIDWDTTLLPDDLTLPLLWAGLCGAALNWTEPSPCTMRFGALWLVTCLFGWCTGPSSWRLERKAWATVISNCLRHSVPGSDGKLWCPSS